MFDHDKTYLEKCAVEIRKYGIPVTYLDEHSILAVLKAPTQHIVGLLRKKHHIPFYQAFMIVARPSTVDYEALARQDKLIELIFAQPDLIINFKAADISGHDNFEEQFVGKLKEQFAS